MPLTEREKLFTVIARRGFEKDLYRHDEVFDEIRQAPFTLREAAEYLEIADITLRRWIKAGRLKYKKVGRNLVLDPDELKVLKTNR
ncbi:MAG: excisionase family DNA-binding protein [Deltaproteobacteria bacterium]|nr:excisionase family DNA-binding protein [Deltaproteobacteria bacterium]